MPKQDNRGGTRPGAGRKGRVFSDEFKRELHDALQKKQKSEKRSFHEMVVDLVYDRRVSTRERVQLIKVIASTFTVKESHQTIDKNEVHKVVMLPPVAKRPQMLVEGAGPVIDGATGEIMPGHGSGVMGRNEQDAGKGNE